MKKLALSPEDLSVESFDTTPRPSRPRGTVQAHDISDSTCYEQDCFCGTRVSCDDSCNGTCDATCDYTCKLGCTTQTIDLTICNRPISLCGACTYNGGTCYDPTQIC
ncbi:MAG TPA: hypothetical protein VF665_05270 [Longimicrobium sp.]|jgi:hypothetical protein|uniref:hypothetical protein n=1 Tax=Longimicrobium sp. TaxID=2029185 RepID=UPI002EDBA6FA